MASDSISDYDDPMLEGVASAVMLSLLVAGAAELQFSFPGIENRGYVVAAVFDSEEGWRTRRGAVRTATVRAADGQLVFTGLPPGRYAAMFFHDVNGDGKLNTLPIGLPLEPYGFSLNARGGFGPPAWRAAAFDVTGETTVQTIRLR